MNGSGFKNGHFVMNIICLMNNEANDGINAEYTLGNVVISKFESLHQTN